MNIPEPIQEALRLLNDAGYEAYLVGGSVRDFVMGKEPHDYDIATGALPDETRAVFENAGIPVYDSGVKHGTVTVGDGIEITTFRTDGDYEDHRHPADVSFTRSLEEDLARRDFTMNALALGKNGEIIDLYGGREDIRQGRITCVGEAKKRLQEDALRILRALRFSATLGFTIDAETEAAIRSEMSGLGDVSGERIRQELVPLLAGKNVEEVLNEYADVFSFLFPCIRPAVGFAQKGTKHKYDVWAHSAHVTSGVSLGTPEMRAFAEKAGTELFSVPADEATLLAAFFHDIGKPAVAKLKEDGTHDFAKHGIAGAEKVLPALDRLKLDRETYRNVAGLIAVHDAKVPAEKPAVKRMIRDLGKEQWLRFLRLKAADQHGLNEQSWGEAYLATLIRTTEEILKNGECYSVSMLAVSGEDLLKKGIPAGPAIGETLNALLERVINDELPNEKETLLENVPFSK